MSIEHVVLDRDGVLNVEDPDGGYVLSPEGFVWIAGALEAIEALRSAGFELSVATNQSAVGRGLLEPGVLEAIHDRIRNEAGIARIYHCPHAPGEGCDCRKPAPGLLKRAIEDSRIPAERTLFVGDSPRDVEAARAAGIDPYLVRTGKGRATEAALPQAVPTFDDLSELARALVSRRPASRQSPAG